MKTLLRTGAPRYQVHHLGPQRRVLLLQDGGTHTSVFSPFSFGLRLLEAEGRLEWCDFVILTAGPGSVEPKTINTLDF